MCASLLLRRMHVCGLCRVRTVADWLINFLWCFSSEFQLLLKAPRVTRGNLDES